MKKDNDKIVVFTPRESENKDFEETAEILNMNSVWVLRNASLLSWDSFKIRHVDILIEGERIVKIARKISDVSPRAEEVDLRGDYVIPLFVNGFKNPVKAACECYGVPIERLEEVALLDFVKTCTAGTFAFFETNDKRFYLLEDFAEKSEAQLSKISNSVAKKNQTLFLRVGQTLEELGTVDKVFHKPLSQVLEDFGFLDRNCVIVGGNCFEKDDWQLFAQYDVSVVVCPMEDARAGRRPLNLQMLKNLGINVMLGSGHSEEIDFFEYMRQILAMQRGMFEEEGVLSEEDVLRLAFGGNHALLERNFHISSEEFLEMKKGSLANFLVVRNDVNFCEDAIKDLVWEKNRNDVLLTVFYGEIVQACSLVRDFENHSEQVSVLGDMAQEFKRLRLKDKIEQAMKDKKGDKKEKK